MFAALTITGDETRLYFEHVRYHSLVSSNETFSGYPNMTITTEKYSVMFKEILPKVAAFNTA
jgi:hypothetical protein